MGIKITGTNWFGWTGYARYFYIIKANQNAFLPVTKTPETQTVLALLFAPIAAIKFFVESDY